MKRIQRVAVLLSLIGSLKEHGSWCGETHIQKSTYLLQDLLEVPMGFEFILYKHGPYSFDLSDEITAMRADRLLKLQPQPYPYGPSILPDAGGERVRDRFPKTITRYASKVDFIAAQLGAKRVADLERLATAFYITNEEKPDDNVNSRALAIHNLKPHISEEEARESVMDVDQIIAEASSLL
jgi:hypothetical protein